MSILLNMLNYIYFGEKLHLYIFYLLRILNAFAFFYIAQWDFIVCLHFLLNIEYVIEKLSIIMLND